MHVYALTRISANLLFCTPGSLSLKLNLFIYLNEFVLLVCWEKRAPYAWRQVCNLDWRVWLIESRVSCYLPWQTSGTASNNGSDASKALVALWWNINSRILTDAVCVHVTYVFRLALCVSAPSQTAAKSSQLTSAYGLKGYEWEKG